ncbi:type II toxin-antitoxin system RelE/ParE family toxin [Streptomyces lutosisoli]|uniref:Type II toxin-antitoxin system RelE/ParE family toxin n=1 Tax=Streptomyces lutosisoli TaxID=2665721 RepID=A0ABW2VGS0_9ACTN
MSKLYRFEIEPEVRAWLEGLGDHDFKRVDEVAGLLAELGAELGGPWSDHLEGPVRELRLRFRDIAPHITYWIAPNRTIVLLTVFRKTKQHDQAQIDRAVRAQKICEGEHHGVATDTYTREA